MPMGVEDAGKEILAWTGERCAPVWNDSARNCSQCREVLARGRTHNCRLCGARFCSLCSAKYHVPPHLRRKAKTGPVRCCFACVADCFRRRDAALPSSAPRRAGLRLSTALDSGGGGGGGRSVRIHPPLWSARRHDAACRTCQRSCGAGHFCRTCGDVFCADCSVKMDVPRAFRKKGKPNPVRVCCQCRFDIFGGAQLCESDPPPPPPPPPPRHESTASAPDAGGSVRRRRRLPLRSASQGAACSSGGGGGGGISGVRSTSSMSAAVRGSSSSSGSGGDGGSSISSTSMPTSDIPTPLRCVRVMWNDAEDAEDAEVCVLEVAEDTPLDQVHRRLLQQLQQLQEQVPAALREGAFAMQCRGHDVPRVFWDIFTMRHIGETLRLRLTRTPASSVLKHDGDADADVDADAGERPHRSSGSSNAGAIGHVRALFSMNSDRDDFLSFDKGDVLELLLKKPGSKWWYGRFRQRKGWIPSNFVEIIPGVSASESGA